MVKQMGEDVMLVASGKLIGESCVKISQGKEGVIGVVGIKLLNGGCEEVCKA